MSHEKHVTIFSHLLEQYYSSYEKDKYNKQLKPNCINLFLRLKLQTKPCQNIDLLHREFHMDSKKSTFASLRLFYELLCISKVHPEICIIASRTLDFLEINRSPDALFI